MLREVLSNGRPFKTVNRRSHTIDKLGVPNTRSQQCSCIVLPVLSVLNSTCSLFGLLASAQLGVHHQNSFVGANNIRLMRSLVTSIFLYACESWILTAELQRRIQAMEMRCYSKILHISYKDHVTNEGVRAKIQPAIGLHEDLLTIVKRRKLQW